MREIVTTRENSGGSAGDCCTGDLVLLLALQQKEGGRKSMMEMFVMREQEEALGAQVLRGAPRESKANCSLPLRRLRYDTKKACVQESRNPQATDATASGNHVVPCVSLFALVLYCS